MRSVSTRPDGLLDVPDDVRTAGWWRGGSRLGDPFGATLIAAHIDSRTQGLGPYVELLRAERDDEIRVRSAHLVQHFRVTSLRLVPRSSLAGVTDIFSASGGRRLVMVTCAGPFDPDRGGYQNLAIVTARPTTAPSTEVVLVKVRTRPSSRQPYPLRMPPGTYWRPPEPAEEVIGYALAADDGLDAEPRATRREA